MADRIRAGIIGATGYSGVALLEVLVRHPRVELQFATTRQPELTGEYVHREHPNLLGLTDVKFSLYEPSNTAFAETNEIILKQAQDCDVTFVCVPSGASANLTKNLVDHNTKIIDTSADFRLRDPALYKEFYGREHPFPDLLNEYVYGLPELHREQIRKARYVACPGCNATAMILAAYPLTKLDIFPNLRIIFDIMAGSSEAGAELTRASHHPERSGVARPYAVKEHRHLAEVRQELNLESERVGSTMFAIPMVRGVECIGHVYPEKIVDEKDLWKAYRAAYGSEPFIRMRAKKTGGPGSLPDVKYVRGSNFCDVGFFLDEGRNRIGVISALDNLIKGDVGNAVQSMNLMFGLDETTRLRDMVPSYLFE
jgi:N-acetyl-gamma-glutamyl-phosphate/LysW-gamma-L-alpha-aminoadipyl-6-phosphate reductase